MGDRGFTVAESLGSRLPKLVIPPFTRGKTQLHPVDVEVSKMLKILKKVVC